MRKPEEARKHITEGLVLEPENKDLTALIASVEALEKKLREAEEKRLKEEAERVNMKLKTLMQLRSIGFRIGAVVSVCLCVCLCLSISSLNEGAQRAKPSPPTSLSLSVLIKSAGVPIYDRPRAYNDEAEVNATTGEVNWPVLFLYPQYQQSDFIASFNDSHTFSAHLDEMFPPQSPGITISALLYACLHAYMHAIIIIFF